MAAEHSSNSRLEVAHPLSVYVVGYCKLLIDEQSALAAQLNRIVRMRKTLEIHRCLLA